MCRRFPRRLTSLVASLGYLVLGCGGDGDGGTPPPSTTIAKAAANNGDAQSGTVGQALATPLSVVVTEGGSASSGRTVAWSTTVSGGSVAPASAVTDANGIASSTWTLGTVSGSQTAQATLSGAAGSPVSFTATAVPDAAATLADAGGNGQSGAVNTQLAAPVQAKVADRFGNGVPGIGVGWVATGGTVSAGSVATDAAGISGVTVTLGGTAGPIRITATSGGLTGSPLTFTATANTGSTTAAITVANNSFTPASITVAPGTTVVWTWTNVARQHNVEPVGTTPARSGAPMDGPATYQFRFDTPGTYSYFCQVHGGPGFAMAGTVIVQ